ncbi:MAG TPA: WbqC family protein [Burkholderiales bacterium]
MIVAIHQPHYMPWLGYLHRMAQVDLFIILDHVQFERRNYQNRSHIRVDGEARWLTVPVVQRSQKERLVDKLIDNSGRPWGAIHLSTLRHAYRQAPHFRDYAAALRCILEAHWERLVDLDRAMLEFLRDAFEIRTPIVRSSELGVEGTKSELILNLCRAVGADALLAGFGGSRGYLDAEAFERQGVRIERHEFRHPAYAQCGDAPFIPGLASVDLLFNCGPRSREILGAEAVSCA